MATLLRSIAAFALMTTMAIAQDGPHAVIDTGTLRGTVAEGLNVFKGVPFAAAPVGALRWRAPQAPAAWSGIRDADSFGPSCPQAEESFTKPLGPTSEDCLFLNIWAPADARGLPVMMWIHGGGYALGSGSQRVYDGAALAKRGVVLVTINYRLGRLGFFAHPALKAERDRAHPKEPMGVYGIMDQIAALQWVKRNIAAFGGDAGNVTIFGESAGGGSVSYLMVSPLSKGLFHRAINQSGGVGISLDMMMEQSLPARPSVMETATAFLKSEGLHETIDAAGLRALPVQQLLKKQPPPGRVWAFVDGTVVPDLVGKMFMEGRQHAVPFLLGGNSFEGGLAPNFPGVMKMLAPDVTDDQLTALYGAMPEHQWAQQWFGDNVFLGAAKHQAMSMAEAGGTGAPVYLYYLTYQTQATRGQVPGVRHADDLPYVFETLKTMMPDAAAADLKTSALMATYWVNFATTGDPNGAGLPRWPAYTGASDTWLDIGDSVVTKPGVLATRLDWHIARFKRLAGIP